MFWYESAANMAQEDECGEFDATMDFPIYELKAKVAELYMLGGFGLDKDPSLAGMKSSVTAWIFTFLDKYYLCHCVL